MRDSNKPDEAGCRACATRHRLAGEGEGVCLADEPHLALPGTLFSSLEGAEPSTAT